MILDSSAVVAIVLKEPGFHRLIRKTRLTDTLGMGAPTRVEPTSNAPGHVRPLRCGEAHETT